MGFKRLYKHTYINSLEMKTIKLGVGALLMYLKSLTPLLTMKFDSHNAVYALLSSGCGLSFVMNLSCNV